MAQALQVAEEGGKREHLGKSKLNLFQSESCHFRPKLRSRNSTWHPLSSRQDACQNGPWHLPILPALQGSAQPWWMWLCLHLHPALGIQLGHGAPQVPGGLYATDLAHLGRDKQSPLGPHQDAGEKGRLLKRPWPTERQTVRIKRNHGQNRPGEEEK